MAGAISENTVGAPLASRHTLDCYCWRCQHHARLDLAALPPELRLEALMDRLRCSKCSSRRIGVRSSYVIEFRE